MKPITLKPEETKSLKSGSVVIWREMEEQPKTTPCPCIGNGEWHDLSGWTSFQLYQPGAEFWVRERWATHVLEDHLKPMDSDASMIFHESFVRPGGENGSGIRGRWRLPQHMPKWFHVYEVRVVSVSPERRETWGWSVELEVI